jgi:sec-independent protein translocase protein TatA
MEGIFSGPHLLILLVVVLIIFGPSKLGDVGGALGKAIRDFKHAMNEPEDTKAVTKTAEPSTPEVKPDKTP